jgi:hypothetical protein
MESFSKSTLYRAHANTGVYVADIQLADIIIISTTIDIIMSSMGTILITVMGENRGTYSDKPHQRIEQPNS